MHSIQLILLIAAVLAFGCILTGPLAWARHSQQHFQRPISHSNHAALVRYYSIPFQLRPPIRRYDHMPHFDGGHRHPRDLFHTPHEQHGHHGHDEFDVFFRRRR